MHPTRLSIAATLVACLLLAACGKDAAKGAGGADGEDALPKPDAVSGSVTGMPNPGESTPAPAMPTDAPVDMIEPVATQTDPSLAPTDTAPDSSTDSALAVLRRYYAAINAGDFATAYAQWRDEGRASGQSPEQFADGFADTDGVSVQFGEAGPVDAGAGQRYIDIPVSVEARQADGSVRRYVGKYTLQLTVVDGASDAQRSWHIATAGLREVTP